MAARAWTGASSRAAQAVRARDAAARAMRVAGRTRDYDAGGW